MSWSAPIGTVLVENSQAFPVEAGTSYPLSGVKSYARGLFVRGELSGGETAYKTFHRVRSRQIVLSTLKGWEGAIALAGPDDDGRFLPPHNVLFDIDASRADPDYLFWSLKRPSVWTALRDASRGMGARRETVKSEDFCALTIPIPSLPEQRRIVARLDATAAAVERASDLIIEIDNDLLQAARNIIWRAGQNGQAWLPCGSFLRQRPLDVRVDASTDYAFAGVYSFGRGVFRSEVKSGSTFSYPALTRVSADNFIYPKLMAWEGALGVVPPECDGLMVSPEFPVFEVDADIVRPAVLDTFFRDPRTLPMLHSASSGTNMRRRRIQPGRFLELRMPIPSADEQEMIVAMLERRKAVLEARRDSLAALKSLLPAMLNEAFGTNPGA